MEFRKFHYRFAAIVAGSALVAGSLAATVPASAGDGVGVDDDITQPIPFWYDPYGSGTVYSDTGYVDYRADEGADVCVADNDNLGIPKETWGPGTPSMFAASQPAKGKLLQPNRGWYAGCFQYQAEAPGDDSFDYQIMDADGVWHQATVTVHNVPIYNVEPTPAVYGLTLHNRNNFSVRLSVGHMPNIDTRAYEVNLAAGETDTFRIPVADRKIYDKEGAKPGWIQYRITGPDISGDPGSSVVYQEKYLKSTTSKTVIKPQAKITTLTKHKARVTYDNTKSTGKVKYRTVSTSASGKKQYSKPKTVAAKKKSKPITLSPRKKGTLITVQYKKGTTWKNLSKYSKRAR